MKKTIYYLFALLHLFSCSSDRELKFLGNAECATEVVADLHLRVPGNLIVSDSLIIVLDPFSSDFALKAYDQFTGEILFTGARVGNGPLEVSTPFNLYKDQTIHLFDVGKQKVVRYSLQHDKKGLLPLTEHFLPSSEFYSDATYLEDKGILVFPAKEQGVVSFRSFADNLELPVVGNPIKKVDDEIIKNELVGSFKLDDSGKYLVFAAIHTPYVCLYRNIEDGFEKVFDVFISEPVYWISDGKFKWDQEENVVGIMDVAIGHGRIFLLHSGLKSGMMRGRSIETIPKFMYEFDYEGNPLKKYHLDTPVSRITMDPGGLLYGIAMDEQAGDFKIVRLMI